jgi:glycosyltransferase involved in cell wall biosynthesis
MGRGVESNNAEIAQLVAGSGHADRFHLLGERRDILDCLASLDIFCLHSVQEGFPNAVAEAMSVGVPCVSTDVGDAALLIGETGKLAPPRNAQAICDALLELVQAGEHHRERLGRMARQRITENFSMDAARKRFEAVYEEVLGPPHPSAGSVQSLGNTIRAAPPAADERIDRN